MSYSQIHGDRILILDFGGQYTQLIARNIREANVYCEIYPYDVEPDSIKIFAPKGVILSGGPETVTTTETPRAPQIVFDLAVPILGICYGMQTMAAQLGGVVETADHQEYGYASVQLQNDCPLFRFNNAQRTELDVWMSHGDHVVESPQGFTVLASTSNAPLAAIGDDNRHYYGVQFHPEVTHTECGSEILNTFVHKICACGSAWTPGNIVNDLIESARKQVGHDRVILGLSGGVDSSVVAALLHKAIDSRLQCIFVDNGLLRKGESEQVMQTFSQHLGASVKMVDAEQRFLEALRGINDPEEKRRIIGKTFIDVFQEEAAQIEGAKWLAQGTIYPDVIESAGAKTGKAKLIKSHHNVGGLPETLHLSLLEPLRELFKDEVRNIGIELGLPKEMVFRHPFPGPGLGVRVLGEIKKEYLDLLREADAIYLEELHKNNLYDEISQAFAVFLPVKSVGVVGDNRAYEYVIALRAVETVDFMTANWKRMPYDVLATISNRIINEVRGISRVTYDISGKPPATIEWE